MGRVEDWVESMCFSSFTRISSPNSFWIRLQASLSREEYDFWSERIITDRSSRSFSILENSCF